MIAMGSGRKVVLPIVGLVVLAMCLAFAGSVSAKVAAWHLHALSVPANLPPGGTGTVLVSVSNLGDAEVNASRVPVKLIDKLPSNFEATSASFEVGFLAQLFESKTPCTIPSSRVVECVFEESLPEYERLEVEIAVKVPASAGLAESEITVAGGESYSCNEVGADEGKYTSSVCSAESGGDFEEQFSGKALASVTARQQLTVSNTPTSFGVEGYELTATEADGSLDKQAGSHPFGFTTTFDFRRTGATPYQPAMPKDLRFRLPPGFVGNPTPFPQCSDAAFGEVLNLVNTCPGNTAVGVAVISIRFPGEGEHIDTLPVPVFNLKPNVGEPARFGFEILGVPVILDTSVRTGEDYGVTVSVDNINQSAAFLSSEVTFWGVPGDPSHDRARGWACLATGLYGLFNPERVPPCAPLGQATPPPLLSMPTSCTGPLQTSMLADSWAQPGSYAAPLAAAFEPSLNGCNRLPFSPSISVAADGKAGSTPSGLAVRIHVPQGADLDPEGLSEADVKNTTVTLPAGVALNPSAADGLDACPLLTGNEKVQEEKEGTGGIEGINLETPQPVNCPEASKVGLVRIKSPLLPNELTGAAYLAAQDQNPFASLVALYILAQDPVSGTLIKLAGEVKPDPVTGQLVSTFLNTPQLPFEDFTLEFFGGDRAPLGTPALCGTYTTVASIAPWSGNVPAEPSSTFDIATGPNGAPCPNPTGDMDPKTLPFSPSLTAGTTSIQAGGYSPFTLTMSREDGDQNLSSIELHMPPGLSGTLAHVKLCPEAQANEGTCGPESLIGETIVSVGLGSDPFTVKGGRVYITEKYDGAPFGLSIVNPAKAGPFDLEHDTSNPAYQPACDCLVVRARIEVNPVTAALTVTSNPPGSEFSIPTIIDGIPLQIKHVNVTITRPEFTFNPTNCDKQAVTGTLLSAEGSSDQLSLPFQVTNCATLGFKPQFSASTPGKPSRDDGVGLDVKVSYPAGAFTKEANIRSVKVELPKQLPSRLSTLQKACTDATFNANPADCPAASRVGEATATTPLVPVPITGPAYFVSHGGAKFPELIMVLSGYGITVDLHGETFINKESVTSSTFPAVPDVPIYSFELRLPAGPDSALAGNGNLCASHLVMPTFFTAQNGATLNQQTSVTVQGCNAAIRVVGHSVKGSHASIRVTVPSAGTLVATGGGIKRSLRRVAQAGTVTIGVTSDNRGLRVLAKNPHQRINAKVTLRLTPKQGAPLTTYVRLLIG